MSRPPNHEFQEWWNKQRANDDEFFITSTSASSSSPRSNHASESRAFMAVDIHSPDSDRAAKKDRSRTARQLSWICLLKFQQVFNSLGLITTACITLLRRANRRVAESDSMQHTDRRSKFYWIIKVFLFVVLLLLVAELGAFFRGWHFRRPVVEEAEAEAEEGVLDLTKYVYANWLEIRADYLAPPLQSMVNLCIVLFFIQSLDRMVLVFGFLWIKMRGLKPTMRRDELASSENALDFPMVLVQIPMCNEREVYQQCIAAVCLQDWPKERMLVQILDDSDDMESRVLIKSEVQKWQLKGVRIVYRHRIIRTGYKAGNLKSAMNCDYVKDYEFVAIFDADFQPEPDFLKRTVPYFKGNDDLALVQTRWSFTNKDANLLTRLQHINLTFHFEVEQQVNGWFINFFGFNGTAGVWRIKALEDSGGWMERTTVEDMDIAVRAHLCGWKFIYLNDVQCLCELPESYEAYKKQQYRWHSGPMQLFRVSFLDILRAKVSWFKKANMIFLFFLLRKLVLPFYSFTLFCIILPMTMFLPEAQLPSWVVCYIPGVMSFMNILPSPEAFPFIVPYLLFENTMSVTKFDAMISGLFQLGSSYEWVVTKKLGRSSDTDLVTIVDAYPDTTLVVNGGHLRSNSDFDIRAYSKLDLKGMPKIVKQNRLYRKELALAFILLAASVRSLLSAQGVHFYFLLFQGISFLVMGLDLIGEQVS